MDDQVNPMDTESSALENSMMHSFSSSGSSSSYESQESGNESQESLMDFETSTSVCEASANVCEASANVCEASTSSKAPHPVLTPKEEEREEFKAAIRLVRRKLIENGDMDKLRALAYKRLSEANWRAEVVTSCREVLYSKGKAITYNQLYKGCKVKCMKNIPQSVKIEVLKKIKFCYESLDKTQSEV